VETTMWVFGLVPFVVIVILTMFLNRPRPHRGLGHSEQDYDAQARIEATDIEQMIEARNDIRRRRGLPEIGDELVAELRHDLERHSGSG